MNVSAPPCDPCYNVMTYIGQRANGTVGRRVKLQNSLTTMKVSSAPVISLRYFITVTESKHSRPLWNKSLGIK